MPVILTANSKSRKQSLYHQVLHLHSVTLHLYHITLGSLTLQSHGVLCTVLCIFCKFCRPKIHLLDAGITHQFPLLMKYQHSKEKNLLKLQHALILVSILLQVNTFTSHLISSRSQPQLCKNHFVDKKNKQAKSLRYNFFN